MTDEAKQAVAILQKEILCVSRDCDTSRCKHCDLVMPYREPIIRAYRTAIKALEHEPCEDWRDIPSSEMTIEQARQAVRELRKYVLDNYLLSESGDAISRQAALNCFTATKLKKFDFILYAREEIKKLPPVNPQPKTGHWLRMSDLSEQEDDRYKCSRCGNVVHYTNQMNLYTFNSWCGRCGSDNGRHIDYDVEANYFEEPHAESR